MDIRDKIAKLLALAESPNEHEARAALLKARSLMAEYKLRPEEIRRKEAARVVRRSIGLTCTSMTNPWIAHLSVVIASHYCCRAYTSHGYHERKNTIWMVGLEEDFEIAKNIIEYACDCVFSEIKRKVKKNKGESATVYRERCNAYGSGFVIGLKAAFDKQEQEHQEWGLVMVIPKEVDEYTPPLKKVQFGRTKRTTDLDRYRNAGFESGHNFNYGSRIKGAGNVALL